MHALQLWLEIAGIISEVLHMVWDWMLEQIPGLISDLLLVSFDLLWSAGKLMTYIIIIICIWCFGKWVWELFMLDLGLSGFFI